MSRFAKFSVVAFAALVASPAYAHIALDYPTARATAQKSSPCGPAGSVRGDVVTELIAGETVTVTWRETVNHPGHFRISFDDDGQDDFVEPASFTDFYTGPSVLYDDIADSNGGVNNFDIVVPETPCDNCTLQVVQVMTDKAPYGDGNDLYYQCADIRIIAAGGIGDDMGIADMGNDAGDVDMGTSTNNDVNNTTNNATNNSTNNSTNNTTNNPTTNTTGTTTTADDDGCTTAAGSGFASMALLLVGLFFRRRSR